VQLEMVKFRHRHVIPVTDELLVWAKEEIVRVQEFTKKFQEKDYYEKTQQSYFCCNRSSECEFYYHCHNDD
jgi:hypothetical protein